MYVELKAEKKALLVGETLVVNCVAKGSDLLEQQWKYPGKMVRDRYHTHFPTQFVLVKGSCMIVSIRTLFHSDVYSNIAC